MYQLYLSLKPNNYKISFLSLVVLLWLLALVNICYAQVNIESPITIDNGLVNNEVTAIHQDKYGFLWFGTRGGLNKYNGYDFELIRYLPKSGKNLSSQAVEAIAEEKNHTLWIGTKNGGLNSYDLSKETITHYTPPANVQIQEIRALAIDSTGTLLIGALHGLFSFKNGHFEVLAHNLTINCVKIDQTGRAWVGTTNGLFMIRPNSTKLEPVNIDNKTPNINSIAVDNKNGIVYMGTWTLGLFQYQIKQGKVKQYLPDATKSESINGKDIYRVYLDRNYDLWVGTWGAGLNKFNAKTEKFKNISIKPIDVFNKDYDIILSINQDAAGIIWVGTDGGGVIKLDPYKKEFKTVTRFYDGKVALANTHIKSVFEDRKGGLWLGTRGDGLVYSRDKTIFVKKKAISAITVVNCFFENNKADLWVGVDRGILIYKNHLKGEDISPIYLNDWKSPKKLGNVKVTSIVKQKNQTIWVGTQETGLLKILSIDGKTINVKSYIEETGVKGELQNSRISCMLVDSKNRLWVGTYNGLHLYNKEKDNFYLFSSKQTRTNALSNNTILSLAEDHSGNIWIGTQQGLNKLSFGSEKSYSFTSFFEDTGLPNDYIHSVLVDSFDNIWLATNRGISKYAKQTKKFINFDQRDGISSNVFSENSSYYAANNEMFFGGIFGVTYFNPNDIRLNRYQPAIFITNLKVNNKDVYVGEKIGTDEILSKSLFLTKLITLSYKSNIVSLYFAALDFHASNKNQYRYRLRGFEDNWVNAGRRRSVTYTNLPPGDYTFEVQASNSDQIWSEESRVLKVKMLPPPWKTWWAYSLYLLIILGLLSLSRSITLARIRLKNKLEIADLDFKKEHEITEIKSKFFANISHEFRTPLTLIIGPLESLSKHQNVDSTVKESLNKVKNQSKRLLSLVNQLLDFNKAETNVLILSAFNQDVSSLFYNVYESFIDEAERKGIVYQFKTEAHHIYLNADKDKLESICYNLLSNAFKFTPNGGEICFGVNVLEDKSLCEINISDTGHGISEIDKNEVFNRFYQVSQAEPGQYAGTGIGLAFVKDLVVLHGGSISVEDNQPKGTIFRVKLPLSQLSDSLAHVTKPVENEQPLLNETLNQLSIHEKEGDLPIILVVEDNEELNHYICETLASIGTVLSAKNGKEGVEKATETIPDLVVSDVMMPEIDGFALCKTLKTNNHTSHIPIILLTAKADDVSHIEGIELGADSYLSKPFNPDVLISHVKNLIKSRKKLKELFANRLNLAPSDVEVTSFDEEFIQKSIQFIEDNISGEKPSIDELAAQLNMSRSTFYRKLKALTGMSGSEFIIMIRIKRSAQLLKTGEYSVSMAAYEVGYNDLKNFRKSFHNQFGMNPSEYLKTIQK
ncbi:hybrid sensor histidine kinase/response regulator transcription factor [Pedobacter arcticus]|uniref:hybrid sensor histidine kinase/response regulator transcription factor n=1 Tax=Pedobacter arcticus TaxID=752140 RepID=UPI000306A749|nr:two-component regulator propeller domain-containing protein [Pedobacter arcticus]